MRDGADGSTKMISKTMQDVRAIKAQLRINRETDHDFAVKLSGAGPTVDPRLTVAAKAVD